MLSSGNLSITQNAINVLEQRGRATDGEVNVWNATSMFDVARLLGDALREVKDRDGPYLQQNNIETHANFLVGGQIQGETARLFEVYSEGNFIEATPDTCYFQIGESKYGKPVLDRVLERNTSLVDATKCTLVSFDSTMRSNISVGLPIDLVVYKADSLTIGMQRRIDETDPYFQMVHRQWGAGLRRVFAPAGARLDIERRCPFASRCSIAPRTASTGLSICRRTRSGCAPRPIAERRFSATR